jgi:hypothetical protein
MIKPMRMSWTGNVERIGEKRNAYRILVEKPEGKRPIERPRLRSVDNIKMDFREIGWGGMGRIDLAQDREELVEGSCDHGNEPSDSVKC